RGPESPTGAGDDRGCGERARSFGQHTTGPAAPGGAARSRSRPDDDIVWGVRLPADRDSRSGGGAADLCSVVARVHTHLGNHGAACSEVGAWSGHDPRRGRDLGGASSVFAVRRSDSDDGGDLRDVVTTTEELVSLMPDAWTSNKEICLRS